MDAGDQRILEVQITHETDTFWKAKRTLFRLPEDTYIHNGRKAKKGSAMDFISLVHKDTLSCEPILRRMPNGELLIVSQCGDVTEPAPGNRVYAFRSRDEGRTWSGKETVYPEDGQAVYLTEVTVLGDEITVYLTLHNGAFLNWTCVTVKSRDNGYTWGPPEPSPCFTRFTFHRGMIRLSGGELVMAYQHYPVAPEANERAVQAGGKWLDLGVRYVESGVMVSHDEGKTFEAYPGIRTEFDESAVWSWLWTEPTLAELSDGRIAMLLRIHNTGCLWYAESADGGKSWSEAVPTAIPNPSNKPKLVALPYGGIALIHTPNPRVGMKYRNPLAIWISKDDMQTWPYQHVVTDFPGEFSYPDGICEDGRLLFSIEYNRHDVFFVEHYIPSAWL